jgi:hypothetical protein
MPTCFVFAVPNLPDRLDTERNDHRQTFVEFPPEAQDRLVLLVDPFDILGRQGQPLSMVEEK